MPLVTHAQLLESLQSAGVVAGDILFVHSSLSRIGNVTGGPQTVVDALLESVGDSGTVVMPAYRSADEYLAILCAGDVLDLRTAPSLTGKITEALRLMPGTHRSSHPFSSCVARGSRAQYIVANHQDDPRICHAGSPVGRALELDAKIVGLGTDVGTITLYHCLEDMWDGLQIHPYAAPFTATYIDATGVRVSRILLRHDPEVSKYRVDRPTGTWIRARLREHFERIGLMRTFSFGCAPSWIMSARALYEEMQRLAESGVTIYSRPSPLVAAALANASKRSRKVVAP